MRPTLVFDGDCGFCRRWIARWRAWTGERVEYVPYQEAAPRFPQITKAEFEHSVQFIEPGGRVYSGAEAVFRSLATNPARSWPLRLYRRLPGFRPASELLYSIVARHRMPASRVTFWLWGSEIEPPTYRFARWLFVRCVAANFLIAFVSLWTQLDGLIGPQGILPADEYLKLASQSLGAERFFALPTLCWLGGGGSFLHALCAAGCAASALALFGFAIGPCLLAAWACYLSLTTVGGEFLSFQWDNLLLEAGFLAAFYAPLRLRSRLADDPEPPSGMRFLVVWLLFKLMLQSGAVKLLSGDPAWRGLTALQFHYETQPLPTWIGYLMHQLPAWFQSLSVVAVFSIELGGPFLMLGPRNLRYAALAGFVLLQTLILLTGNYCFFNLLTLALCAVLLDDGAWRFLLRKRGAAGIPTRAESFEPPRGRFERIRANGLKVIAAMLFTLSLSGLISTFAGWRVLPRPIRLLMAFSSPWRSVNNYGLFAVMTTTRPEIVVEGSSDGENWKAYEFKWKPGDLKRRPAFVEPHQPRLDWQMWFAALGSYRDNPWFMNFLFRLLEGSPPVLKLLAKNPFPDAPPSYIRSTVYQYRFTDLKTLRSNGSWWQRQEQGPYAPIVGLR
jgi:lipase maturation factor 1